MGEHAKSLHRRRQSRSAQTPAKVLPQAGQDDLHRPAIQHRQGLRLQGQLQRQHPQLSGADGAGGQRGQQTLHQLRRIGTLPLQLAQYDVPAVEVGSEFVER